MRELHTDIPGVTDDALEKNVVARLDDLTKPKGSLGRLEEFVLRYCRCRGSADASLEKMALYTFAGDHGITQEKITPYPPEVTRQMAANMAYGGAAVSVMCRKAGIGYGIVDMGINGDCGNIPGLIDRKVARGTANFRHGPAMSPDLCAQAIRAGFDLGAREHVDLMGTGDMGIGNTASASALYSMILDVDPAQTVGPGTGSAGEVLARKKAVVTESVARRSKEWDATARDALRLVGGFEIAGLVGLLFGCASRRVPVVIDGFIASAAALVAMRMNPAVKEYLFFSHVSAEPFHRSFMEAESIEPILSLGMRLGEGTGAVLAMQIIAQAMACYHGMATFGAAGVAKNISSGEV